MEPSLQIGLNQNLALTPQLQQAIQWLQLPTQELIKELMQAVVDNPLLELENEEAPTEEWSATETQTTESSVSSEEALEEVEFRSESPEISFSEEPNVDFDWSETYAHQSTATPDEEESDWIQSAPSVAISLHEHLHQQIQLMHFSERDQWIAEILIDDLQEDGFLSHSLEELHAIIITSPSYNDITLEECVSVLKRLQQCDPIGVASRNIQECLLLQLSYLPAHTPGLTEATVLIEQHLDGIKERNFQKIQQKTRWNEQQLSQALQLVRSLNPKPGYALGHSHCEYITADLVIYKKNAKWIIEFNEESIPKVRINHHYHHYSKKRNSDHASHQFIKQHLQEARFLIKSIQNRNETLLKTAQAIMHYQVDFLEHGPMLMKPLILQEIAQTVGVHESTISRITTQKYILTPQGLFELKYFFSSQVSTESGHGCSSTAIRAMIKRYIEQEDRKRPLSDHQITSLLREEGIHVARRTVTKYREALHIPPSRDRKGLS